MNTIVCGRSPFARNTVCPKAKRKTWIAIITIYVAAAAVATVAFSVTRSAQAGATVSHFKP